MKWGDGSHRPRRMTVEEFEAMGYDRCRTEVAKCYDSDGNRKPEGDMRILVGPIGGRITLKTRLTRWDRWRDRR